MGVARIRLERRISHLVDLLLGDPGAWLRLHIAWHGRREARAAKAAAVPALALATGAVRGGEPAAQSLRA